MRLITGLFCAACAIAWPAHAQDRNPCGDLQNGYGPYDYRVHKKELKPVEDNHFDAGVEQLKRGISGSVAGDLDYTLRSFPNHHRALMAMDRLTARAGTEKPPRASYTIACYYDRAVRFRPDDGVVRMLYAHYLARKGKPKEAITHLQEAEKLVHENANLYYNMGLAYLDLKDYDKALTYAHRAYQLGFPLPGLRTRLERAGKWRDPLPQAKVETPVAAAAKTEKPVTEAVQADTSAGAGEPAAKP